MLTTFLKQYDVIIFDCDGVLINVNHLKCEAFGRALEGYSSEIVEDFVKHCKNSFGISRYVKFREFISDFAREQFHEEKYNKLLEKYAEICKEIYGYAEITPGCKDLLAELVNHNKNLYVASGSDESELKEVMKQRNLSIFFKGVYGSPKTKLECTSLILENHPDKQAVFIGDAISDMKTAKELGLDFIYMSTYSIQSEEQDFLCKKNANFVINTLGDLLNGEKSKLWILD